MSLYVRARGRGWGEDDVTMGEFNWCQPHMDPSSIICHRLEKVKDTHTYSHTNVWCTLL